MAATSGVITAQYIQTVKPVWSTGNVSGIFEAMRALALADANVTFAYVIGARFDAWARNSSVVTKLSAFVASPRVEASATAGTVAGVEVADLGGGGTVTDSAGVLIGNVSPAGVTTGYGLKIGDQTGATTAYAIHTGEGLVRFGDDVISTSKIRVGEGVSAAVAGDIRYNTGTSKHQGYDGTNWNDMY
jgi:hypothetical protein